MDNVSILPGGADYAPVVSAVLAEELDRTRQLITFGASLVSRDTRQFVGDERMTYKLATSMNIGAIKTLQSVCNAAEAGSGHDVTMLVRSLFETAMAIQFVIRDEVEIEYGKVTHKPPREVRARMVLAHQPRLKLHKHQQNCKDPTMATALADIPAEHIRNVEEWAAEAESHLAPEWIERMDGNRNTYCGKQIREIATFLEKPNDIPYRRIYQGLYNDMSRPAHGMSFMDHIKASPKDGTLSVVWHCDPVALVHSIDMAAMFVIVGLQSLSDFCGYVPTPVADLEAFRLWFADSQQHGDDRRPKTITEHEQV
ncbi:MAG: DUF5677 domain-containing protein [Planctomycetia bacterium]|nr:DUF5677 domain-containing protein [Planctomycetia bacterium]